MGIEKLLPTFTDLEVFLQLLPRSSTGERMNPYTSLWTGVTPGDGPQEFHLILLDNGRTNALADRVGRAALHCIRCSACLNVCPVYERTGGHAYGSVYPGPIGAVLTPMLTGMHGHGDPNATLPYASSLCGACYDVCPVKIDIPTILVELRGQMVDADRHRTIPGGWDAAMKAASWVMSDEKRFAAAESGLGLGRLLGGRQDRIRHLPPPLSGWTASRDLPAPPAQTFRDWWTRRTRRPGHGSPGHGSRTTGRRRHRDGQPAGTVLSQESPADPLGRPTAPAAAIPRDYIRHGATEPGSEHVIELLTDRLVDYKALVDRVAAADLPGAVDAALTGTAQRRRRARSGPGHRGRLRAGGRSVTTDSAPQGTDPAGAGRRSTPWSPPRGSPSR